MSTIGLRGEQKKVKKAKEKKGDLDSKKGKRWESGKRENLKGKRGLFGNDGLPMNEG